MSKLTENSFISLSLAGTIVAFSFAAGAFYKKVENQEEKLAKVETSATSFQSEVIDRLARIETMLKRNSKEE